jgi:hypothetical protein
MGPMSWDPNGVTAGTHFKEPNGTYLGDCGGTRLVSLWGIDGFNTWGPTGCLVVLYKKRQRSMLVNKSSNVGWALANANRLPAYRGSRGGSACHDVPTNNIYRTRWRV